MLNINSSPRMVLVPGMIATRPVILQPPEEGAAPLPVSLSDKKQDIFSRMPLEIVVNMYRYLSSPNQLFKLMLVNCKSFDAVRELLLSNVEARKLWNHKGIMAILGGPDAEKNLIDIKHAIKNMRHAFFLIGRQSSWNNIKFEHSLEILDLLADIKNIESLHLAISISGQSNQNKVIDKIKNILENCPDSTEILLTFQESDLSTAHMLNLGAALNKKVLKFSIINNSIGNEGLKVLGQYFKNTSISEVVLEGININSEGLKHLKEIPKNIERLGLSHNDIGPEGMEYFREIISKNIVDLRFARTNMCDNGIKILCNFLKHDLNSLNLIGNSISNQGLEYLSSLLKSNIQTINLSDNNINNDGVKFIIKLLEKGVRRLNLNKNYLSMYGINFILKSLKNTEIEYIDLRFSKKIKDEQVNFIVGKMPEIDVEYIDMRSNELISERKKGYVNKNGKPIDVLLNSDMVNAFNRDNFYYLSQKA